MATTTVAPRTILSDFADEADKTDAATAINGYIYRSKDMGDSFLVTTNDGDVVINTGFPGTGKHHRQRFAKVSEHPLKYIILTQCHANQFGGAVEMKDDETQIITQARYSECRQYWIDLHDFYARRSNKLWGSVLKDRADVKHQLQEVTPDLVFDDQYVFELGQRRFELYATPGGESMDALVMWLPEDRILFSGNLFGPIFGHIPNLYTIRGDKIRSALRYIQSLERVLALEPAMIITGHEVVEGAEQIRVTVERLKEAVVYIREQTLAGMNDGTDIHQLMAEIQLPEALKVGEGHGKVSWCVRAIWEEYAGWFHYDSTTALYATPFRSVAVDVVELAGTSHLVERAQHYCDRSEPLKAIHLADLVLATEPDNRDGHRVRLNAHAQLLEQCEGENFSELMWLKSEIHAAEKMLESTYKSDSDDNIPGY